MDWLYMYMPIAGVSIFWPGLVLIGFSVGTIGGFFGMGGAWMVTPGLNILGFPMAFAIGTDMAHIAGKSMISTMRHAKFGNVDYKLGFIMVIGTFIGIEVGAQLVMYLERLGRIDAVVRYVYVIFLALIAFMVFYDYAKAVQKKKAGAVEGERGTEGITWYKTFHKLNIPPMVHFKTAGFTCSAWLPSGVSFLTGVLAGFLGIGGGLFRMPALVYLIGLVVFRALTAEDIEKIPVVGKKVSRRIHLKERRRPQSAGGRPEKNTRPAAVCVGAVARRLRPSCEAPFTL